MRKQCRLLRPLRLKKCKISSYFQLFINFFDNEILSLILCSDKKKELVSQFFSFIVGAKRLELSTPCTPCKCASQLRHAPNKCASICVSLTLENGCKSTTFFSTDQIFFLKNHTHPQRYKYNKLMYKLLHHLKKVTKITFSPLPCAL